MAKRPSTRSRDLAQRALDIVEEATGEVIRDPKVKPRPKADPPKNPAAVALGKLGGAKGGKARAKNLSAKRLSDIGKAGARARWGKDNSKPTENR